MIKTFSLAYKILIFLSLWPGLGLSQPGGDRGPVAPFLAPRDRAALHLSGVVPLVSAQKAKIWLQDCPTSSASIQKQKFCDHYFEIKRAEVTSTQHIFWSAETQLLIFGERHTEIENRVFLTRQLDRMTKKGFNTLALEMFNSNAQEKLDQYLAGRLSKKNLKALLQEHWNYPPESYLKLIQKAKSLGMNILALDDRSVKLDGFSQDLIRRDQHMAQKISEHFENHPQDRIIALTGRLHAYKSFSKNQVPLTIIEMVRKKNINLQAQSFLMISPRETTAFSVLIKELIHNHPTKLISSKSFLPYTDGLIHLESSE